ncbi:MAG TPA: LysR substrate-binding domain-containing protein, partial [Rhodospirillales bacterium]|nr:LysR substrate-binding domain-containing protein [Rhodospirillales bacterium]
HFVRRLSICNSLFHEEEGFLDRLQTLEVFAAVADAGSLAAAARRLRLSPPAVTRAIAALESRLGARRFNRTTRSLSLTEAGVRFLADARRLLADLEEAERSAAGEAATPSGHLTLTASVTFGRTHVAAVLLDFLRAEPRVTASLLLLDRVASLVEEGIDVAVRIGNLPDSTLVARRVGEVRRVLVASPAYLAERGVPQAPADLRRHQIIAFTGLLPGREWRFEDDGRRAAIALSPRLELNDATAAIAGAEQGFGITVALSYMVARSIAEGRLTPVLDRFTPPAVPVQLVYPHGRSLAAKVRAFVDFATPALQRVLRPLTGM